MSEPAILRAVREALEQELAREDATYVLASALGAWGPRVPVDVDEVRDFLGGPLASALGARLPASRALRVVRSLDALLDNAELTTAAHTIVDESPERGDSPTQETPVAIGEPVPVLVVAGGRGLTLRLAAQLRDAALLEQRGDEAEITRVLARLPLVVLVDASDVPELSPERLLALVESRAPGALVVLYGQELPYGRHLLEAAMRRGRELSAITTAEGVEAVRDLIRARGFQRG